MAYIGNDPSNIQRGRRAQYHFTATASQTVFSGTDDDNQTLDLLDDVDVDVYFNGSRLILDDDYTISGDTLTLTAGASAGDILVIVTQDDIVNLNSYTKSEADDRYINYNGDIVSGDIQVTGEVDAGSLIVDTTTLVVNGSTNRVGIGTDSPIVRAHIKNGTSGAWCNGDQDDLFIENGGNAGITIGTPASNYGSIAFADSSSSARGLIRYNHSNDSLAITVSGGSTTTFDSSGNLLVGKSATNIASDGFQAFADGYVHMTADISSGSQVLSINRKTSDGDLVLFRKDGSEVGSIGSISGDLYINSTDEGRLHVNGVGRYSWSDSWFTAQNDNVRDLGLSAARWKDLYLSGKITNDGTGGINIDTDGRVGIGTGSSINADFHIYQGVDNRVMIESNGPTLTFKEINSTDKNWNIYHNAGDLNFQTLTDGFGSVSTKIIFKNDGNVGIATTSPTEKLEVAGNVKASDYILEAIDASIADTAVDIFIYDTSKDSDGGAWRKRTQHTSWYNETLNTSTRGSRKEFPAVAVIILEVSTVTIYDGDDPNLPMWMKWTNGTLFADTPKQVRMVNGKLIVLNFHTSTGYAQNNLIVADFISEIIERDSFAGAPYGGTNNAGLSYRDSLDNSADWIGPNPYGAMGNRYGLCLDVIVEANATLDPFTGLPHPTIAIGQKEGTTIIKSDKTIVQGSETNSSWNVRSVLFDKNGNLWGTEGTNYSAGLQLMSSAPWSSIASIGAGTSGYQLTDQVGTGWGRNTSWPFVYGTQQSDYTHHVQGNGLIYTGYRGGVTLLKDNPSDRSKSMVAYITPSWCSGWMVGDIKLATLAETSTSNISDTGNILVNGTFSNLTGWSNFDASRGTVTNVDGTMQFDNTGTGDVYAVGELTEKVPRGVSVTFNGQAFAASGGDTPTSVQNYLQNNDTQIYGSGSNSNSITNGSWSLTRTVDVAGGMDAFLHGLDPNNGLGMQNDNMSVVVNNYVQRDRSHNDYNVYEIGTITKTPVATGADIVAYSGFSTSNYMRYASKDGHIDFGTDDFCVMVWVKRNGSFVGDTIVHFNDSNGDGTVGRWLLAGSGSEGEINFFVTASSWSGNATTTGDACEDGKWSFIVATREGTSLKLYVNGVRNGTTGTAPDSDISNPDAELYIGTRNENGDYSMSGSITMLRITGTIPTEEQIQKIYKDEKQLFQENASCTMYGSNDLINDITFDDDTELLHVGTSDGRSVFQGLRRVDNTTDAVGVAISASNGMVAED